MLFDTINIFINTLINFIWKFKDIFIFYLAIIIFFYIKRKKLDFQAKIIVLYRMKFGLKFIEKFATKFRKLIILWGYIGTGIGFIGILIISYLMIKIVIQLIIQPSTSAQVSLVLPGMNIPGLGVLPFWYWILAIFMIALVHEFSHGIVARAHKIEVKNTGLVLLGPIIGAFVEPNENKLNKAKDIQKYSVLAAGSFSNILLAILAFLLLIFVFVPIQANMAHIDGWTFQEYVNESLPFSQTEIMPGTIITGINNVNTISFQNFSKELNKYQAEDDVIIRTKNGSYPITFASNPDNESKPYMGIMMIQNNFVLNEPYQKNFGKSIFNILDWFTGLNSGKKGFLEWLFILSLGIGLFNLLPLPIVDGGRMMQVLLHRIKGKEKGERWYIKIGLFFLLILLISLFFPLIVKWLGI